MNFTHFICRAAALLLTGGLVSLITGCAADPIPRQHLDNGEAILRSTRNTSADSVAPAQMLAPKFDKIIQEADMVIVGGDPQYAAEGYYLRGRALEGRPKFDAAAITHDLLAARRDYEAGLKLNPPRALGARLNTQLGNVAYNLDDYPAALVALSRAYDGLDKPQWKAAVLYYMGSSQQRLGRFTDADRTFARLQQLYPTSDTAGLARQLAGAHAFYVQVGVFSQAADIEHAAEAIVAAGANAMKTVRIGLTTVRTGDIPSYSQAVEMRNTLRAKYPDAKVMP